MLDSQSAGLGKRESLVDMYLNMILIGRLANRYLPDIPEKEIIRYELTQPHYLLTQTGLQMKGQCTFLENRSLKMRIGDFAAI